MTRRFVAAAPRMLWVAVLGAVAAVATGCTPRATVPAPAAGAVVAGTRAASTSAASTSVAARPESTAVFGTTATAVPAGSTTSGPVPLAATPATPLAYVGPLFKNGMANDHSCTATVLASPHQDLILTAAHCVSGTAAGYLFVPGYARGSSPYGVWTVEHAYVDPAWRSRQDPADDYAILQVAARDGRTVQQSTGGVEIGPAPVSGTTVTVVAYNAGRDDVPVQCRTSIHLTSGQPSFDCHGFVGGSSGSPWLRFVPGTSTAVVAGVIGGYAQGGCEEYTSYSSSFGARIMALSARAVRGENPDTVPAPGDSGC